MSHGQIDGIGAPGPVGPCRHLPLRFSVSALALLAATAAPLIAKALT